MNAAGVPAALLPLVIATEVLGGLAITVGWQTRVTALLLAGFTLLSALLFHNNFADQIQTVMFLKNVSIAGGFLLLAANGAGPLSVDGRMKSPGAGRVSMPHRILISTTSSIGSYPTRAYTALETGFAMSVYKKQLRRPASSNCRLNVATAVLA